MSNWRELHGAKDWRDDYYEIEVFTTAVFRSKILVKVPQGSDVVGHALKVLESKPTEFWVHPSELDESLEFEIGMINDKDEDGCGNCFENTPEHLKDAIRMTENIEVTL